MFEAPGNEGGGGWAMVTVVEAEAGVCSKPLATEEEEVVLSSKPLVTVEEVDAGLCSKLLATEEEEVVGLTLKLLVTMKEAEAGVWLKFLATGDAEISLKHLSSLFFLSDIDFSSVERFFVSLERLSWIALVIQFLCLTVLQMEQILCECSSQ